MLKTKTLGIFQPDLILRAAIIEGLTDLYNNPWLLDYVFASIPQDELTSQQYGAKELKRAKDWFLKTEIPVIMAYQQETPTIPSIIIQLADSAEDDATLGDIHFEPFEDVDPIELNQKYPPVLGPFTPKTYDSKTGIVTLPKGLTTEALFADSQVLVDQKNGKTYAITDVIDEASFAIRPGTKANFANSVVYPVDRMFAVELESVVYRETYRIGVHCGGDFAQTLYLYSILLFVLMRYKESLLEARGFYRTTLSATPIIPNEALGMDRIWTRYVNITGWVRQYWPKLAGPKILGSAPDEDERKIASTSSKGFIQVKQEEWEALDDNDSSF